jgi:hypothetical protein
MAKLKNATITAADLDDFARNNSDFGFEMRVLGALTAYGFRCEHGGPTRIPFEVKFGNLTSERRLTMVTRAFRLRLSARICALTVPLY